MAKFLEELVFRQKVTPELSEELMAVYSYRWELRGPKPNRNTQVLNAFYDDIMFFRRLEEDLILAILRANS